MLDAYPLDVETIDNDIKAFARLPTSTVQEATDPSAHGQAQAKRDEEAIIQYGPQYRIEGGQKYSMRKVFFKEAYSYGQKDSFKLLQFLTCMLRIFNLEYLMGRNNTPASQVQEMEQAVYTGREFWGKIDKNNDSMDKRQIEGSASDAVIKKILERKNHWTDL